MSSTIFNAALFLDSLCRITPVCLYVIGLATVARKALLLPERLDANMITGLTAAVWILAVGIDAARRFRKPFSQEYAAAWLDWKNRAGGAILAGAKETRLKITPRLTLVPFAKSLVLPLVFVCATLFMPAMQRRENTAAASLRNRVAEAEERVGEREESLAEPDRERFAQQLEELKQLAETNPEATAEALASLERRLAEAEALRLERAAEALEAAADLIAAEQGGAGAAAAQAAFQEAMEEMIRGEGGLEALPESLQSALSNGGNESAGRNGAQSEQLTNALREWSEQLANAQAGSGETGERGSGAENGKSGETTGEAGSAARDRLLSAGEALDALESSLEQATVAAGDGPGGDGQGGDASEPANAGVPGSGGVSRGRADAPLLLGAPSRRGDAGTALHALPRGDSDGIGTTLLRDRQTPAEPLPPEEFRASYRSAHDAPASVSAGSAHSAPGPARARAVERYFRAVNENSNEGNAQWPTTQTR